MMVIKAPDTFSDERRYIVETVLSEWLGLACKLVARDDDAPVWTLTIQGAAKGLEMPDSFFSGADAHWCEAPSLPDLPLDIWTPPDNLPVLQDSLPVLYGRAATPRDGTENPDGHVSLPIDVLGSAFFMLSRYEEVVGQERDKHDRFPSWASISARAGLLERPIIDEYMLVLKAVIRQLWPGVGMADSAFRLLLSHDVDVPSRYGFVTPARLIKRMGRDVLDGKFRDALYGPVIRMTSSRSLHRHDPVNAFDWMMETAERAGLRSAYYFLCGRTSTTMDADYEMDHPAMLDLIRRTQQRGHEIGLHPSFNTYLQPALLAEEAANLRRICAQERIDQECLGGRMHFLRWSQPKTACAWEAAGMDYDSTLGYADHAGFRCGTCREFTMYDVVARRELALRQRPLIAMEVSIMSDQYMGLGCTEAAHALIGRLKDQCRLVGGDFTLLWHNTALQTEGQRQLFEGALQ